MVESRDSWGRLRKLIGRRIGPYEVRERLGQGGTSEVYRALDTEKDRMVAIKILASAVCEIPQVVTRFKLEAQIVSRIDAPGIVEVLDFGELDDGRAYYVMELLEGQPLTAFLESSAPLSLAETYGILRPVMETLIATHEAGIVHRDIKPDNIFLCAADGGPRGRPKILDFGIAKMLDTGEEGVPLSITTTGQLLGTPLYMSPEQISGDSSRVGPWSDVYSVGVVLYHMLVGQPPYRGRSFSAILVQHTEAPPPNPRDERADLPAGIDTIFERAMAKPPEDRYRTMDAFQADLAALAAGEPVSGELPAVGDDDVTASVAPRPAEPRGGGSRAAPTDAAATRSTLRRLAPWIAVAAAVVGALVVWLAR